jgi:sodium-dependent dicarboxylate transporter 2/3/5
MYTRIRGLLLILRPHTPLIGVHLRSSEKAIRAHMTSRSPTISEIPTRVAGVISSAGLLLGPVVFALLFWFVPASETLTPNARAVLALSAWVAIWWMTEAVPLAATSLLPMVALPLLKVATPAQAAAPYADPIIFLFMGGFIIGLALERVGLHRRLALRIMLVVGSTPRRLVAGVMLATAGISMFISNSAAAMMLTPLALSIVSLVESRAGVPADGVNPSATRWTPIALSHFACAMLLGVGYAASLGGMGTPIGTPPNLVMTGYVNQHLGIQISFLQWAAIGVPMLLILLPALYLLLVFVLHPLPTGEIEGGRGFIRSELRALGPISREESLVVTVFLTVAALWIFRLPIADALNLVQTDSSGKKPTEFLIDSMIAVIGALALLVIPVRTNPRQPVLSWTEAERIPWGILLLFGGGLSLAWAIGHTGLDKVLAAQFAGLSALPPWLVLLIIVSVVVAFSELAGNTAVAQITMPILAALAAALKFDPLILLFAATLAASCGFALPVATPPNAIVFATGKIGTLRMARAGIFLDLVCICAITALLMLAGPTLLHWVGLDP